MQSRETRVLIMAAGTGGHIIPALAIAERLQRQGAEVHWLGTPVGLEQKLLRGSNIPLHVISVSGLRGKGLLRILTAPLMLVRSLFQALSVIGRVGPDCVLGMGGYVSGPGGVAARLRGIALLIHEQNAVAGLTNRLLARFACQVLTAFPQTFPAARREMVTGNPVRAEIGSASLQQRQEAGRQGQLRLLVLGGSQGARAINEVVPELIAGWKGTADLQVWHQCGERLLHDCRSKYDAKGIALDESFRLDAFIEDMAAAYRWADIVLCRSGASTVFELAAAGLPSILVPYPHHADRQQEKNAEWLVNASAAKLMSQDKLSAESIGKLLERYAAEKTLLIEMGEKALAKSIPDSADKIARCCLEVAHGH